MVLPVHDVNPTRRAPWVTRLLLAVNVVVFLLSPIAVAPLLTDSSAASLSRGLTAIATAPERAAMWKAASWQIGMQFDTTLQHARLPDWVRAVARIAKG